MHDNSRKSPLDDLNLNTDPLLVNHSDLSERLSVLKFSDDSDSDTPGAREDQVPKDSYVCGMRDLHKPKDMNKIESWKDGKRFVNGQRKEVRFSNSLTCRNKNVCNPKTI